MPEQPALDAGPLDALGDGQARRIVTGSHRICVVRIGDDVYAIGDTCSHADVSLSEGEIWSDACEIECPKHGSAFSLRTGEPQSLPATRSVPVFPTAVVDGRIRITVPSDEELR